MVRRGRLLGATVVALLAMLATVCVMVDPALSQNQPELRVQRAEGEPEGVNRAQQRAEADPAGPLADEAAVGTDDDDEDEFVDRLDIEVPNCTVAEDGATITIQDEDGTQGLLVDDPENTDFNVDIIARPGRIVVVGIPRGDNLQAFFVNGGNERLFGNFTVVTSSGIRCGGESNGTVSGDENETPNENPNDNDTNNDDNDTNNDDNDTNNDDNNTNDTNDVVSGDRSEVTVIRENTVIRETIPGKNLPETGGEAGGDASTAGLFAGAGVFVLLGALLARVYRSRNS